MANEPLPDEMKVLWQSQELKEVRMSLDEIRSRSSKVTKTVRKRTALGAMAESALIAYLVWMIVVVPNVVGRIGACLTIVALTYIGYQLHSRRGRNLPPQLTDVPGIRAYRAELERQRDFHRGTWLWSRLLILVPSYLLLVAGVAIAQPQMAMFFGAIAIVALALAILAVPLNWKAARMYQHRLNELDILEK